jgi:chromate transporter
LDQLGVSFREALRFWIKLGFISFGGPAGQISIMHRELVDRRRWLSEQRFLHALSYCMLLPGPEAQQLAIYIGWLLHRVPGGIVAGSLFVIPSIFILLALSYAYVAFGNLPLVAGVLAGFKPVVVAIIVEAVIKIGGRALTHGVHYAMAALMFIVMYNQILPFPMIVVIGAVTGILGTWYRPNVFSAASGKSGAGKESSSPRKAANSSVVSGTGGALFAIGDDSPSPSHTLPSAARFWRTLGAGIVLWLIPFLFLIGRFGWESLFTRQYRFFTQAALVTFGGAYAVLAYVTQIATDDFGWISSTQAMDGLALAETTPGPLIMVLQFVGFMAGWNHPEHAARVWSATLGALVTTYATFLPCFIFIFLGGPYVEVFRAHKVLNGALAGIMASVVGAIANLGLMFAVAVIWPNGLGAGTNWTGISMSVAAFLALYRFKADVVWIILAGGAIGLGLGVWESSR